MHICMPKLGFILSLICPLSVLGCGTGGVTEEPGMIVISSTQGWIGCDEALEDSCTLNEGPRFAVDVASFQIDTFEVQVSEYTDFLNAHGNDCGESECAESYFDHSPVTFEAERWSAKEGLANHPMTALSWYGANAYCLHAGKRLCSEVEWEVAALGSCDADKCATEKRVYPWGNDEASCTYAHMVGEDKGCGLNATAPVGSYPAGASPYGVQDMSGNAWEWVADTWREDYQGATSTSSAWIDEGVPYRVVRGGGFGSGPDRVRGSHRFNAGAKDKPAEYGFRCCK